MNEKLEISDSQKLTGLDEEINALLKEWNVCGAAISVFEEGSLIYAKSFGMRDPGKGLEVNDDTLFRLASNTKAFTAMSLCMLVNDGKLELDTPIKEYLPSFKLFDSFATERMTARDLLTHRSGIPAHDWAFGDSKKSRKDRVELLHHMEPNLDLRTKIQYSNNMYMTVGYLVEHLSGMQWEAFVQERIFNALGMADTNFSAVKSRNTGNYALHFYEKDGELGEFEVRGDDPEAFYPRGPAGSINSSLNDLNKWLLFYLNKGTFNNKRLISENLINQMFSPQMADQNPLPFPEVNDLCSGLGWFTINYRGYRLVTHGGFFGTCLYFIPAKGIAVAFLPTTQGSLHEIIPYSIFDRLLGLPELPWNERYKVHKLETLEAQRLAEEESKRKNPQIMGTSPSHQLEDYIGLYKHPAYGELVLKLGDNKLVNEQDNQKFELVHYHYDTFDVRSGGGSLFKASFQTDARGRVISVSAPMEPAVKDIVFVKEAVE